MNAVSLQSDLAMLSRAEFSRTIRSIDKRAIEPEQLIHVTCNEFDITPEDLHRKNRKRPHVQVRQCLMHYLHKTFGMSSTSAGEYFEKDHATVLHACKVVENYETDFIMKPIVERFNAMLAGIEFVVQEPKKQPIYDKIIGLMIAWYGYRETIRTRDLEFKDFLIRNGLPRTAVNEVIQTAISRNEMQMIDSEKNHIKFV